MFYSLILCIVSGTWITEISYFFLVIFILNNYKSVNPHTTHVQADLCKLVFINTHSPYMEDMQLKIYTFIINMANVGPDQDPSSFIIIISLSFHVQFMWLYSVGSSFIYLKHDCSVLPAIVALRNLVLLSTRSIMLSWWSSSFFYSLLCEF